MNRPLSFSIYRHDDTLFKVDVAHPHSMGTPVATFLAEDFELANLIEAAPALYCNNTEVIKTLIQMQRLVAALNVSPELVEVTESLVDALLHATLLAEIGHTRYTAAQAADKGSCAI